MLPARSMEIFEILDSPNSKTNPISLQNSFVRLKLKTPSTGFTRCICTPDFFIYSSSHKDPNKTELFYLHLPIRQFQTRLDGPKARSYLTVLDEPPPS
ncbi:hypothetical protein EYR41_002167 [Orbilia oligospora]|uniref:Uncharacterized protein n=1 Tax=Orbilia oligospora TaxID=2813651 RepID=A0A8H2I0K7_ORBOL|nr:hypothetical protein EYR41_002167 [Orbilia oligospora]